MIKKSKGKETRKPFAFYACVITIKKKISICLFIDQRLFKSRSNLRCDNTDNMANAAVYIRDCCVKDDDHSLYIEKKRVYILSGNKQKKTVLLLDQTTVKTEKKKTAWFLGKVISNQVTFFFW